MHKDLVRQELSAPLSRDASAVAVVRVADVW